MREKYNVKNEILNVMKIISFFMVLYMPLIIAQLTNNINWIKGVWVTVPLSSFLLLRMCDDKKIVNK